MIALSTPCRHICHRCIIFISKLLCAKHGVSYQRVVLAWELAKGDHMFVIPGAHRPETILDSLKADELELTDEELAFLG